MQTVRSRDADAMNLPSGEHLTQVTCSMYVVSDNCSVPVRVGAVRDSVLETLQCMTGALGNDQAACCAGSN